MYVWVSATVERFLRARPLAKHMADQTVAKQPRALLFTAKETVLRLGVPTLGSARAEQRVTLLVCCIATPRLMHSGANHKPHHARATRGARQPRPLCTFDRTWSPQALKAHVQTEKNETTLGGTAHTQTNMEKHKEKKPKL